ncbi:hypothetical protein SAY87_006204 [Trapa incisa]|uniref:Increased DNA methylation 1 C-terminal domain-containing protein n=1 Tax=Trapa incisa TaxID=236973 RepID=A0AAN7Q7T3_9MYRT|nr:hypothetical protein SAY87_006204 [Trapa incisa]
MDTLEKKLKELGVKRIILPASPSALSTWIGSFGFKEMMESKRLGLVNYTLLNFQDTIMCQKQLLDTPSEEWTMSNGKLRYVVYESSQLHAEQNFTERFSKGPIIAADSDGKLAPIHEGLLELEEEQIDVGMDELTLTFIKPDNFRRHDDADLVVESAAENYGKLNMALGIMHECFEPFLDLQSGRD